MSAASKERKAARAKPAGTQHQFHIKRVYYKPSPDDGLRFLVDRLWPRGVKKSALASVTWLRDVAPSPELRRWFGHEPAKWAEFRKRYYSELKKNQDACQPLWEAIQKKDVTLFFAARDRQINHAVVLKRFLEEHQSG
jgi:uncharacterized protein YeaO (DUF488 family)